MALSVSDVFSQKKYYWEKIYSYPDTTQYNHSIEAADGIICVDKRWYSPDTNLNFKPITDLVPDEPKGPDQSNAHDALYWVDSVGKWMVMGWHNSYQYNFNPLTNIVAKPCTPHYPYCNFLCGEINYKGIVSYQNELYATGYTFNQSGSKDWGIKKFNLLNCQWEVYENLNSSQISNIYKSKNSLYFSYSSSPGGDYELYKTDDWGLTKTKITYPKPRLSNDSLEFVRYAVRTDKRGHISLMMTELAKSGIRYISSPRFYSIVDTSLIPLPPPEANNYIYANNNYKGSERGNLFTIWGAKIFKSTNKGKTWDLIDVVPPGFSHDIAETKSGAIYVTTTKGVYKLYEAEDNTIGNCASLHYQITAQPESKCSGGKVKIKLHGGTPPYQVSIHQQFYTLSDSLLIDSLRTKYYPITITDQNTCKINTGVYVNWFSPATVSAQFDTTLLHRCTPYLNFMVYYGGLPPYTISWKDGNEEKVIHDAKQYQTYSTAIKDNQEYQFSFTDSLGCIAVSKTYKNNVFIPRFTHTPDQLCDSVQIQLKIDNTQNRKWSVNSLDEVSGHSQSISFMGDSTSFKLPSNVLYRINVIDINQCARGIQLNTILPSVTLNTYNIGCINKDYLAGQASVSTTSLYQPIIKWDGASLDSHPMHYTNIKAGKHTVSALNDIGCGFRDTFEISQPVASPVFGDFLLTCPGDTISLKPLNDNGLLNTDYFFYKNDIDFSVSRDSLLYMMPNDSSRTLRAYAYKDYCYSPPTKVFIPGILQKPMEKDSVYHFCKPGDTLVLKINSHKAHWYSLYQAGELAFSDQLKYPVTFAKDTLLLYYISANNKCQSRASKITFNERNITPPAIAETQKGNQTWLKPQKSIHEGIYQYDWYRDSMYITTADSLMIVTTSPAVYQVIARSAEGCSSLMSSKYIVTSLDDEILVQNIEIYPNPAQNEFRFSASLPENTLVSIYNTQGALLRTWRAGHENKYGVLGLSSGMYICKFQIKNQVLIKKLIIE